MSFSRRKMQGGIISEAGGDTKAGPPEFGDMAQFS